MSLYLVPMVMITPNDELNWQTPPWQALAQIAFWQLKTEDERMFAHRVAKNGEDFAHDMAHILRQYAKKHRSETTLPQSDWITIFEPGEHQTLKDLGEQMTQQDVDKFIQWFPRMIESIHASVPGKGWMTKGYNMALRWTKNHPQHHWAWATTLIKKRSLRMKRHSSTLSN